MTRIVSAARHSRVPASSVTAGVVFARLSSTSSSHSNGPSPSTPSDAPWHALIRTHHITSRKKVAKLRHAASEHGVFAMLRSGGAPGIMYVVGKERESVEGWVTGVQKLRYKDYHLAIRPAALESSQDQPLDHDTGLDEISSVKEFGLWMQKRGLLQWWRKGMGYTADEDRL